MSSLSWWVAQLLAAGFLAVLFLQSGLDKVVDWKGNREYIAGYFAKTALRSFSTPLLFVITILEVLAGASSAIGVGLLLLTHNAQVAWVGAVLSALCILSLFAGQRLAKDYAAAGGMVSYALLAIGAVLLQGAHL
jgi:uncharacterized membrane protein YphA (DoxX/SURF4 family)